LAVFGLILFILRKVIGIICNTNFIH